MVEHDHQRRTVLKGAAVAALASIAGSTAGSAQETDGLEDDVDREEAATMLREFYDGYLEGISQAVATEVQMEALMIEDGRDEPWPLAVWDDAEDARHEGITLGASEGGADPFLETYQSFDREFDSGDSAGEIDVELLETNDPVPAGETLAVTARLENTGPSTTASADLVIGHDPQLVDHASPTVDEDDDETVTLEFETGVVPENESFPVRVEGDDDTARTSIVVVGTEETL